MLNDASVKMSCSPTSAYTGMPLSHLRCGLIGDNQLLVTFPFKNFKQTVFRGNPTCLPLRSKWSHRNHLLQTSWWQVGSCTSPSWEIVHDVLMQGKWLMVLNKLTDSRLLLCRFNQNIASSFRMYYESLGPHAADLHLMSSKQAQVIANTICILFKVFDIRSECSDGRHVPDMQELWPGSEALILPKMILDRALVKIFM